ncbi:hypothetical protein ADUPG1_003546, partial [Aduncisulcus paluster]
PSLYHLSLTQPVLKIYSSRIILAQSDEVRKDVMCEMWRVINAGWNGEGKELRCGWKWLRAHEEEDEEDIAEDEMGTEGKEPDDDDLIAYKEEEEEEEEEEGPGKEQEGGEIEEETIHKAVSSDSDDGKDHLLAHHTDITRQE